MAAVDQRYAHFVDVPLHDHKDDDEDEDDDGDDDDNQQHQLALTHHPLKEISESAGHLLLLKLWQREGDLSSQRIARKESLLLDSKRQAFLLSFFLFVFHALFLTVLFTSTSSVEHGRRACVSWWVPGVMSAATSVVLVCAVQARVCSFWRVSKELHREKGDARALQRCVQELRMKGRFFDLWKEPQVGVKAKRKSSSVEVKWRSVDWSSKNLLTVFLLCFSGLAVPACKLVLCG